MIISPWILMRNMFQIDLEKIKTHFTFYKFFFRKRCSSCVNLETYGAAGQVTDGNIIQRMRFECRINKTRNTDTLTIHKFYSFSKASIVTRTLINVTVHVSCLSCLWLERSWLFKKGKQLIQYGENPGMYSLNHVALSTAECAVIDSKLM